MEAGLIKEFSLK